MPSPASAVPELRGGAAASSSSSTTRRSRSASCGRSTTTAASATRRCSPTRPCGSTSSRRRRRAELAALIFENPRELAERFAALLASYWEAAFEEEWQALEPRLAATVHEAGRRIAGDGVYAT